MTQGGLLQLMDLINRRVVPELPPLLHLRQHDEAVTATLPVPQAAPGRTGAFVDMRSEATSLAEFLHDMGQLDQDEDIYLKPASDATKLTNSKSLCIYSVQIISAGSEIGIVGAVEGGDSYEDMKVSGAPFFEQVKELATNPVLRTKVGDVAVKIRIGGDLVNILEMMGLSKATSNFPCPTCHLPRVRFSDTSFDPALRVACNGTRLGRTRATIWNEAIKQPNQRKFSVKHVPLCPIPRDPNGLIIDAIVFCELHITVRLCGK